MAEAEVIGDELADGVNWCDLLALAGDAVADEVVPVALERGFRG